MKSLIKAFSTTNFQNAFVLKGCIRIWKFYNDTTLQGHEAHYPLLNDLVDATGNYSDVSLSAKVGFDPPNLPTLEPLAPLCHNGEFINFDDGQDTRTFFLNGIDESDFEVGVDFKLDANDKVRPIFTGSLN